jgi:hypothetical protein
MFPAWIPGLRKAAVITRDERGRPHEVLFEFSTSRTFSLVYTYDDAQREVRWEPQLGKRDAVRGSARFDAHDDGTRMTYVLEPGVVSRDRVVGDIEALVASFVQCMHDQRPSSHAL